MAGQLSSQNTNLNTHLEDTLLDENEEGNGQVEQLEEGENSFLGVKKRHGNATLMAEWSQDVLRVKRMKLESHRKDRETDEGGRKGGGGREGRRRKREELKEQLEEARERLQALQEKVWRAFGEKNMAEEKKKKTCGNANPAAADRDGGMIEDEDMADGMFDEEDVDGGEMEKEPFSLLSPFDSFNSRKQRAERQRDREGEVEGGGGGGGELHLEGVMEGVGLWLDCGGVVKGDWDGGMEDEGEQGGQKFAQALKVELGSAVARVIDRVLRIYTETTNLKASSPPAAISFLPSDTGTEDREAVWMGLLTRGRVDEMLRGGEKRTGGQDGEREKTLQKASNDRSSAPSKAQCTDRTDLMMPLAAQRSPDIRKAHPFLGPPLPNHLNPTHQNHTLHHSALTRPPPLAPPASQSKEHSSTSFHQPSSSSSSSSSSFPAPPPPPPLPLPLLHYSMQQLFSRTLHHPQLPHFPPSRKDYLNSDPFLEFSSHPAFPPLPLLGHLDPSLARHGGRERDRGIRGGGGMEGGEIYLTAGGISFLLHG